LNPLKNLYQWVLSWAESAYGVFILFCVSFAESSFFPVPADPLLIALAIGNTKKSFYYAFMCTLGSVVGGIFGYMIGYFLWWTSPGEYSSVAEFFFNIVPGFTTEVFDNIKIRYETYNFIVIFTAAFTPIPYKVFSISAGAFSINLPIFIIASILGRGLRFYMISTLVWFFGDTIKAMLDKYFNLFIIILTIIFCLSYFLIGYLF
jgi:membrane protein YqaA with SNARE-associated domain